MAFGGPWKFVERASGTASLLVALIACVYTVASFYRMPAGASSAARSGNASIHGMTGPLPWLAIILAGASGLLVLTSWLMVAVRVRAEGSGRSRSTVVFDSRENLRAEQLVGWGDTRHDGAGNRTSEHGKGRSYLTEEGLEIRRENFVGVFMVDVRPAGPDKPTATRIRGAERSLKVEFQARTTGDPQKIRCVAINWREMPWYKKWSWIESRAFQIYDSGWQTCEANLSVPVELDAVVQFRDDLSGPVKGELRLRNIVITQIAR